MGGHARQGLNHSAAVQVRRVWRVWRDAPLVPAETTDNFKLNLGPPIKRKDGSRTHATWKGDRRRRDSAHSH
jgi:hypothetical protein